MRTIALEEHFTTPAFLEGPGRAFRDGMLKSGGAYAARVLPQGFSIGDLGEKHIAEMDTAGLDMQVLSLNYPGTEQSEMDAIAAACVVRIVAVYRRNQSPTHPPSGPR